MSQLDKIVGLTVHKVIAKDGSWKFSDSETILFTDGKTIMELEEQDYYTYHDCSTSAREVEVYENSVMWERLNEEAI